MASSNNPPSSQPLITFPSSSSRVSTETITKAVDALLKWISSKSKNQKAQLLDHDELLYVILTLKKIPSNGRINPYKIPLPHPLHPFDGSLEICLIVDDREKAIPDAKSVKQKIQAENIPISKVIKLSKLKSDYQPYEAKRKLCGSFDLFFADKRVVPMLPRLLGKHFFRKKKIPVPVDLGHKNWKEQIRVYCGCSRFYLRAGTCSTLKVGMVRQGREEIVENAIATIEGAAAIVPKGWGNVRSVHLRALGSVALPIYQAVPELGLKIEGYKKEEVSREVSGGEIDEAVGTKKRGVSKKGRLREVRYMDVGSDDFGGGSVSVTESEIDELGSDGVVGKKRKKSELRKEDGVKVKKAKRKNGELGLIESCGQDIVGDEVGGGGSVGDGSKKKKKKSKMVDDEALEGVSLIEEMKQKKSKIVESDDTKSKKKKNKEIDDEALEGVSRSDGMKQRKSKIVESDDTITTKKKKKEKFDDDALDRASLRDEVKEKKKNKVAESDDTKVKKKKKKESKTNCEME
eukprot:TRINITY_DN643_c0_g2_i1.p1 TRINITY_DN643_c0_g2~~TRINITY_DN643_c0_g2_i1.p1  ORF type:complete len:536 (+),score=134.13 TRINITY_DN643_c0_g2_i1:56-1609(+)